MKKIIVSSIIFFVIFIGLAFYNSQRTVECWWGVMYPTLSFIAFEDEENETEEVLLSSNNPKYIYIKADKEEPVKMRIAIVEWFKKHFGEE